MSTQQELVEHTQRLDPTVNAVHTFHKVESPDSPEWKAVTATPAYKAWVAAHNASAAAVTALHATPEHKAYTAAAKREAA